jgi:hypothetical protein
MVDVETDGEGLHPAADARSELTEPEHTELPHLQSGARRSFPSAGLDVTFE